MFQYNKLPLLGIISEVSDTCEISYNRAHKVLTKFNNNKPTQPCDNAVITAFRNALCARRTTPANRKVIDKLLNRYFPDFDLSQGGEK